MWPCWFRTHSEWCVIGFLCMHYGIIVKRCLCISIYCLRNRLVQLATDIALYCEATWQDLFLISGLYHWMRIPNTSIVGYNILFNGPITVKACLALCEANSACLSVDYWKHNQICKLGSRTPVTHQASEDIPYDLYVPCMIIINDGRLKLLH